MVISGVRRNFTYLYFILNIVLYFVLLTFIVNTNIGFKNLVVLVIALTIYYVSNVFNMRGTKYKTYDIMLAISTNIFMMIFSVFSGVFRINEALIMFGTIALFQIVFKYIVLVGLVEKLKIIFIGQNEYTNTLKENLKKSDEYNLMAVFNEHSQDLTEIINIEYNLMKPDIIVDFTDSLLKDHKLVEQLLKYKLQGLQYYHYIDFYEVFERKLLDYKTIELLKIFTIMNSDKIEKYPILKKYKISKFDQRVAIAIRLLLNASTKLNLGEEKVYESVFVKAKARLKYDTFFDEVLGYWHDTIELLDDREILKDSIVSHSKEVIKFATCDTLLNINDAVRVSLMKYLFIDFKESKHISLKYSTIKMIEMIKKYSLRYLNSFSNLDWDLSESRYKLIRNTLSKEKTNKFNYVVTDEILKISNLDYNNILLDELQGALNNGSTLLDIIKGK